MKKKFKIFKSVCSIFIVAAMVLSLSACKSDKKESKEPKMLNIFLDKTDEYSSNVIKFLMEDFKKNNPDIELKLNDVLGDEADIMETINVGTKIDLIFTNRNTLIDLSKKGVLSDLQTIYDKGGISNRYYDIMTSYGRVGDKYYGIGIAPYSIELLYNKEILQKLKISNPENFEAWLNVLKQVSRAGTKVPVVLPEDIDINGLLFSLVASKVVSSQELEESYEGGEESYKKVKSMQEGLSELNTLVKDKGINKNSFEIGNEQSINNFTNGDAPLLVATSTYYTKLTGGNIGIIEQYDNKSNGYKVPIIVNSLVSIPLNAQNGDSAGEFIKYIYSDEVQERMGQKGIISGNRNVNNNISGIGKIMVQHLFNANDKNMVVLYNLPKDIKNNVLLAVRRVLEGSYSSKQWEELLKETYK